MMIDPPGRYAISPEAAARHWRQPFRQKEEVVKKRKNWWKIVGVTLHVLIGGLLILTGAQKVLGFVPPAALGKYGLGEYVKLIGAGAILCAVVLLIPRTTSLGALLTSAFWGGSICIHMAHGEPYLFQAVMLVLTWVGAYLRNPLPLNISSSSNNATWVPGAGTKAQVDQIAQHTPENENAYGWVI